MLGTDRRHHGYRRSGLAGRPRRYSVRPVPNSRTADVEAPSKSRQPPASPMHPTRQHVKCLPSTTRKSFFLPKEKRYNKHVF